MQDIVVVAIIGAVPGTLAAIVGVASMVVSLRNSQSISVVAKNTDGINAAFNELTSKEAHARGMLDQSAATNAAGIPPVTPPAADNVTVIGENVTVTKKPIRSES